MTGDQGVRAPWELRVELWAARDQAIECEERVTLLLRPDPDHAPPKLVAGEALADSDLARSGR